MTTHAYGWVRDRLDARDHYASLTAEEQLAVLPASVSMRGKMPPVYDQGQLGSCTANAIAGAVQYQQLCQNEAEGQHVPSRLFIYYGERVIEGSVDYDSGAQIRDGIKVVASQGAPPETDWPYDIARFTEKPRVRAYQDALRFKTLSYARPIRTSYYLRSLLAAGRPFVYGFTVYESFESEQVAATGIVPMPDEQTEEILGGHAVLAIGYKQINGHLYFETRNSWSSSWADSGHFWMPLAYLLDQGLSSDFWDIKVEE